MFKYLSLLVALCLLGACSEQNSQMQNFHQQVCQLPTPDKNSSVWHIRHLYDCDQKVLFIPYQLWTGAPWDGNKDQNCMHPANNTDYKQRRLIGPIAWENTDTGETEMLWRQNRPDGVIKHFKCHDKGIGKRLDSRKPDYIYWDYRCYFPAGYGWELKSKRHCFKTTIEITHLLISDDHTLERMTYDWWVKDQYEYRFSFAPNIGRVRTPKEHQRQP